MKIIQQFKTLVPGITGSKELPIPCQIDFDGISYFDHHYTVEVGEKEVIDFYFDSTKEHYKSFQITTANLYTAEELEEMAVLFEFDVLCHARLKGNRRGVLIHTPEPENILYSDFYKNYDRQFCVIRQINGHNDTDVSLPLIWRVAEIELSPEFSEKLEFYWKEELKVYKKGPPPGYNPGPQYR